MSDNESDWSEVKPYSARAEWSDVTPIADYDGPTPVVPISYSPECMLELRNSILKLFIVDGKLIIQSQMLMSWAISALL